MTCTTWPGPGLPGGGGSPGTVSGMCGGAASAGGGHGGGDAVDGEVQRLAERRLRVTSLPGLQLMRDVAK